MADKKPIYQPWNEDEFQSGMRTRRLNYIQKWMYRSLLQSAFYHPTRPFLPLDDETLWVLAGARDLEHWIENKASVLKCFQYHPTDPSLIRHDRVCHDWQRLVDYRKKMSDMGKLSGEARRTFNPSSTDDEPEVNSGSAHDEQTKRNDTILNLNDKRVGEEKKLNPPSQALYDYADKIAGLPILKGRQ